MQQTAVQQTLAQAQTALQTGEAQRAAGLAQEAIKACFATADRICLGDALVILGRANAQLDERRRAIDCYDRALNIAADLDLPDLETRAARGMAALKDPLLWGERALSAARRTDDHATTRDIMLDVGEAAYAAGKITRARELADEAAAGADDPDRVARAYGLKGRIETDARNFEAAREALQEAFMAARKASDPRLEATALDDLVAIYRKLDLRDKVLEVYEYRLKIAEDSGNAHRTIDLLTEFADEFAAEQNYEAAVQQLNRALDRAEQLGDVRAQLDTEGRIGALYVRMGFASMAVGNFQRMADLARQARDTDAEIDALGRLATAQRERGEIKLALESHERAIKLASARTDKTPLARLTVSQAKTLQAAGRADDARRELERARTLVGRDHPLRREIDALLG
ncbi:MAG: hypothetical protein ACFB51_04945 [Anaerolineae bacterium]